MKTIDEMADAYCRENAQQEGHDIEDVRNAYLSGAEHVHEELTRWHDPKEVIPEQYKDVEVKDYKGRVSVCNLEVDELGRRFWNVSRTNFSILNSNIIGWREIHE